MALTFISLPLSSLVASVSSAIRPILSIVFIIPPSSFRRHFYHRHYAQPSTINHLPSAIAPSGLLESLALPASSSFNLTSVNYKLTCLYHLIMADIWTHEFCLGCDRQTDDTAYCSESCRLADFEKTSMSSSMPSIGSLTTPFCSSYSATGNQRQPSRLYLGPAIDFTNPQPFGTPRPSSPSHLSAGRTSTTTSSSPRTLTTSSSNTSLCSMQSSTSSNSDTSLLPEKTRQELHGYAASFDNVRLQRRRSS
ncbi:hypothetical protein ACRALDRAFT_2028326 [Sodiomyces alcalophilus JCM 7366]|uniref:uncharacterized protein n=1 Tax=Sodiomyces alcalophilus JCM 7366 TaxID=591952 RepID=UPI0039B499F2